MEREFSRKATNIVKGMAILFLLNYHLFSEEAAVAGFQVDYRPFPQELFLMFSRFGNISVAVFVFLTAFGITKGLLGQEGIEPRDMYRQAGQRMLRLMVNFFALFASVTLLWQHWFDFTSLYGEGKQGFLYMLADAAGFAQILDTPTLNMTWWYMEIAYVLIFLIPLFCILVQKVGYFLLPIVFFLPVVLDFNPDIARYLFTAAVGVCAAYGNWMDRLLNQGESFIPGILLRGKRSKSEMDDAGQPGEGKLMRMICLLLRWAAGAAGLLLCVMVRQNYFVQGHFLYLADAGIAVFFAWFSLALFGSVPVIKRILEFIGRHSMNIYMVHTFFYLILWRSYIYAFRYWGAILAALLLASLVWSVVLEWVKKIVLGLVRRKKM